MICVQHGRAVTVQATARREGPNRRREAVKQVGRSDGNWDSRVIVKLTRIDSGAYASLVGKGWKSRTEAMDPRDVREVTLLVSGVTRMRRKLDGVLEQYCQKPLQKLQKTETLQILRLGVYELVELEKPGYVINEHVKLAKPSGMGRLVNGILRNVTRDIESGSLKTNWVQSPELVEGGKRDAAWLSVVYSHPEWMIQRWLEFLSLEETCQLMQHNNRVPAQGVRCLQENGAMELLTRLQEEGVEAEISPFLPSLFLRIHSGLQHALLSVHRKAFVVQDESAGLVVAALLRPEPGDCILDCCAAPGGKLFFTAQLMQGTGMLTAVEANARRLKRMQKTAHLLCFDSIQFKQQSLQDFAREHLKRGLPLFDKVLLDVPCSGTGVLGKKADLRWKRAARDLTTLIALQDALLDVASRLVKPGGRLVYSTCSIEPEENDQRIDTFLASHSHFAIDPVEPRRQIRPLLTSDGCLRTWPHHHGVDGAFAVALRSKL